MPFDWYQYTGRESLRSLDICTQRDGPPLEARALHTLRLIARQPPTSVTSLREAHWLASDFHSWSIVGSTDRPSVRSILRPCKCAIMLADKLPIITGKKHSTDNYFFLSGRQLNGALCVQHSPTAAALSSNTAFEWKKKCDFVFPRFALHYLAKRGNTKNQKQKLFEVAY